MGLFRKAMTNEKPFNEMVMDVIPGIQGNITGIQGNIDQVIKLISDIVTEHGKLQKRVEALETVVLNLTDETIALRVNQLQDK